MSSSVSRIRKSWRRRCSRFEPIPGLRDRLVARQFVRVDKVQEFDVPALLERVIDRASGHEQPFEVQIQGPFETSYSLAVINRKLACGLDGMPDRAVSIYATEGPGDYEPDRRDLARHPRATALFRRSRHVPVPARRHPADVPPEGDRLPRRDHLRVLRMGGEPATPDDGARFQPLPQWRRCHVELRPGCVERLRVSTSRCGWSGSASSLTMRQPRSAHPSWSGCAGSGSSTSAPPFPARGLTSSSRRSFPPLTAPIDVTLILKTFPNPHNEVGDLLERLKSNTPNPPDVRWIDRDLDDAEVLGLYNLAHCYVHPARGEGFGLPVAEAMVAGVPVISLSYSGLADFVSRGDSDDRSRSASSRPAPTSHVPDSIWAEPDRDQLGVEMRRMVEDPDRLEVREWVQRALDLISRNSRGRPSPVAGMHSSRTSKMPRRSRGSQWSRRGTRVAVSPRTPVISWTTPTVRRLRDLLQQRS